MTPNELIDSLNRVKKKIIKSPDIVNKLVKTNAATALNLKGVIQRRIQNTGKKAEGGQLGKYSTKEMLVGPDAFRANTFRNKVFKDFGDYFKVKKQYESANFKNKKGKFVSLAVLPGGYKQLREINGLNTSFVDLTFSDKTKNKKGLWSLINIQVVKRNNAFVIELEGDNAEIKKRIGYLGDKYDTEILRPSRKELDAAVGSYIDILDEIFLEEGFVPPDIIVT